MTDAMLKRSIDELLAVLSFRTDDAAHQIDAITEAFKQMHKHGGGKRLVRFSMSATQGNKLVPHSPAIVEEYETVVSRRRVG